MEFTLVTVMIGDELNEKQASELMYEVATTVQLVLNRGIAVRWTTITADDEMIRVVKEVESNYKP